MTPNRTILSLTTALTLTVGLLAHAGQESKGVGAGLPSNMKFLFQCSEVDSINTPVDLFYQTQNGYQVGRYINGKLVAGFKFAGSEVKLEPLSPLGYQFDAESRDRTLEMHVTVAGHASTMMFRTPQVSFNRPHGVICTVD